MLPNLAGLALRGDGDDGEEEVVPTEVDTKGTGIGKVRLKPLKKRIELPSLRLPDGTVKAPCGSDPECARVVAVKPAVVEAVVKLFANTSPAALSQGRDLRDDTGAPYKSLRVKAVFEIEYGENNASYKAYIAKKAAMLVSKKKCDDYGAKEECTRTNVALAPAVKHLMQMGPLAESANETFLLHGSYPSALLAIMQAGFKTDMSQAGRQAYGAGIYQAEDVGKADQYASSFNSWQLDVALGLKTEEEVRAQMLGGSPLPIIFYMLVTRTLLGCATHMADHESFNHDSVKRGLNDAPAFETLPRVDENGVQQTDYVIAYPYDSIIKEHSDTLRGRAQWKPQRYREFLVQRNDQVLPVMIVAYTRDRMPVEPPYDPRTLHCDIWSPVAAALRSGSPDARYRAAWQVRQALEEGAPHPKEGGVPTYWFYNEMYKADIVEALAKVATERMTREDWEDDAYDFRREHEALKALTLLSQWSANMAPTVTMKGMHTVRNLLRVYVRTGPEWGILDLFAAMLDKLMVRERVTVAAAASAAQLLDLLSTLVQDHHNATRKAILLKVGLPRILRAWAVSTHWKTVSDTGERTFVFSHAMMTSSIELMGGLLEEFNNDDDNDDDEETVYLDEDVIDQFMAAKGVQGLIAIIKYHSVIYETAFKTFVSPYHPPLAVDAISLLGVLVSEGIGGAPLALSELHETLFDPKWTPLVDPRPVETLREALVRIAWEYPRNSVQESVEMDMAREAIALIGFGCSLKPLDSAVMCGALKLHLLRELTDTPAKLPHTRIQYFVENEGVVIPLRVLNESRVVRHQGGSNPRPSTLLKPDWYDACGSALELLVTLFDWNVPQSEWQTDGVTKPFEELRASTTREPDRWFLRNLVDLVTVQTKNQLMNYRMQDGRKDHHQDAKRLLHHLTRTTRTGSPLMWRQAVRKELQLAQEAGEHFPDDVIEWVLRGEKLYEDTTTNLFG